MRRMLSVLFLCIVCAHFSYAEEKVQISSESLGEYRIKINFSSGLKEFMASFYRFPISGTRPSGAPFVPYVLDDTRSLLIFSALEGELVDISNNVTSSKEMLSDIHTEAAGKIPSKQVLYMVDVSKETITKILELGPNEIYAYSQKLEIKDKKVYFQATKDYVIDLATGDFLKN